MHVSTAAVSQIVRRVERRVGTALFTRTTRHVELTDAGRQLVDELLVAHEQIQDAVTRAVDAGRKIAARLRIGYMSAAIGHHLLGLIDSFQRPHPGCEVTTRCMSGHRVAILVRLTVWRPIASNGP